MSKAKGKGNKKKTGFNEGPSKKQVIYHIRETEDIDEVLKYTYAEDDDIRLQACSQLCPCKVLKDIEVFWDRVFEMADDSDPRIRKRVLHIICDGSPERVVEKVYETLGKFNYDKDPDIRRTAHKCMVTYEKTGKWNIL